jgi:membrane protein YqaA with SNARE-associated domain
MRRGVLRAVLFVLLLLLAMAAGAAWFERELLATTEWVYQAVGTKGLLAILFVNDAIISPVPPDAVLIVVAKTTLHEQWPSLIFVMGLLSALAGMVAWSIGRALGNRFAPPETTVEQSRHARFVKRYGGWSVALAALTPLPFSIACLGVGALRMPFTKFWWLTLLRVPRFYIFYLTIAYFDRIFAGIF